MIKTLEMRKAIQNTLKLIHTRVYFHTAPQDAEMPYIMFDFTNSIDSGALENFVLEIDVWDDNTDTTILESIANAINETLNKKTILINNIAFTVYLENRINLLDDDPRIRRRKYIYQARTYQKYY